MKLLCFILIGLPMLSQADITPSAYLNSLTSPNFNTNSALPHLTRWGYTLGSNTTVVLAKNWGYTLTLQNASTYARATNTSNPGTFDYGMVQLAKNNPETYKLSVIMDSAFITPIPADFYCTNAAGDTVTNYLGFHSVCPEGPDSYWQTATEYWMQSLRIINSNAPITIILNGGEYGMGVAGWDSLAWGQDPRVIAATNGLSWARYSSNRKAHQLGVLTAAIEQEFPSRELSIFYNTGHEQLRINQGAINDWKNTDNWGWNSDVMNTNTDLPSFESYFSYNHGWTNTGTHWSLVTDLLTRQLNAIGYNLSIGANPLNYSWVNCGGTNVIFQSEFTRYKGFLKCLYTGGMVGGIAGFFDIPAEGFDASFPANSPPNWLQQMIILSQVHAEFSWIENYIYDGTLLTGPQSHALSSDQSSYEFTNTAADATCRVLARKLNASNDWLICAWAAAGANRNVTVNIPTLGTVTVYARDEGSVYKMTTTSQEWVDGPPPTVNATFGTFTIKQ